MYQCIDVALIYPILDDEMAFFPVLRRPGRQRWTRVAFTNPGDAMLYGFEVARRFARLYAGAG